MKPDELSLFQAIEKEFIQLNYRWEIFRQLYDSGQENVDLLNKSGSNVFQLMQKLLLDDVMMCLCRLTDRDKSMGNENASLKNIYKKIVLPDLIAEEVSELLTELDKHMKKITTLRNKALSHYDLTHALNTELLPKITYDEIDSSIETIRDILNKISGELLDSSNEYVPMIPFGHDGNKLLKTLRTAHDINKD
jgi:HEPN superfamily AbiU2-like protein